MKGTAFHFHSSSTEHKNHTKQSDPYHRQKKRKPALLRLYYPEKVESGVEHFLNDLLEELFEHSVLIDPGLVDSQVVDKLHTNEAFNGISR